MKAAIVAEAGATPVYSEFPAPTANEGEITVTVTAAALTHVVKGRALGIHYSADSRYPFVVGVDGVGRLPDGELVFFFMPKAPFGSMAEQTLVRRGHYVPIPDGVDDVTAAAIANPGVSSWAALTGKARLVAGETVLVNGATGVAGRLAVQVARRLGAGKVIGTGRDGQALSELSALGADATVSLQGDAGAIEDALKEQFAGGVDVVLDYLWGPIAERTLVAAAKASPEGRVLRYVEIGSAAGPEASVPGAVLRSSSITLLGSGLGSVGLDHIKAGLEWLFAVAGPGGLGVAAQPVPLSRIAEAWTADTRQRIVIVPAA